MCESNITICPRRRSQKLRGLSLNFMAIGRSGPIVTSVSGSVGGTTFRTTPGAQVIQSRRGGPRRLTTEQEAAKQALARASAAWRDLTPQERDLWAQFAAENIRTTARGSVGRQAAFTAFVARESVFQRALGDGSSVMPQAFGQPSIGSQTVTQFADEVGITGLDFDSTSASLLFYRLFGGTPKTVARGNRKVVLAQAVSNFNGFFSGVAYGQRLDGSVGNLTQSTAAAMPASVWLSTWVKWESMQGGFAFMSHYPSESVGAVVDTTTGATGLLVGFTSTPGGQLTFGQWHCVTIQILTGSNVANLWIDEDIVVTGAVLPGGTNDGTFSIGSAFGGGSSWLPGRVAYPALIQDPGFPVTPAQLYQDGQGLRASLIAGLIDAWLLVGEAPFADAGVNASVGDIDVSDVVAGLGPFALPIATFAEMWPVGGQREWEITGVSDILAGVGRIRGRDGLD